MRDRRRLLFVVLLAALLVFLGLVFQDFLLADVVVPVATVIWLLLRIFVLSIGQQLYWWLLIVVVIIVVFVRLLREPVTAQAEQPSDDNPTLERVAVWQSSIVQNLGELGGLDTLRPSLVRLLATLYAPRQQGLANFQVEEVLRRREIPVPDPVYAFLLVDAPAHPRPAFFRHPFAAAGHALATARRAPVRWVRRWSGREAADYFASIDAALSLMEDSLEMNDDGQPYDLSDHRADCDPVRSHHP